jgi:hypothetical protein
MQGNSSYDKERLIHINHLMDTIHDSTNEIYEALVDRDFDSLQNTVGSLIAILKEISLSTENEV